MVQEKIGRVWFAIGKLRPIFISKISDANKMRLYKATVEAIAAHGLEPVPITPSLCRQIEASHRQMVRAALGTTWPEAISTAELTQRAKLIRTIRKRRLRLVGHVIRMPARFQTPLTFQLFIKRLFFFKLFPLCGAYPQINLSTSSSTTFSHSFSFTISFSRPPQPISLLYPKYPRTMSSPSHPLQTTHLNHPLSSSKTSTLSSQTTHILCPNPHPKAPFRPSVKLQVILAHSGMRGCTFLFMEGRCRPPQPSG